MASDGSAPRGAVNDAGSHVALTRFGALIERESRLATALLEILEREHALLGARRLEPLEALAEEKTRLTQKLDALAIEHRTLLESSALAVDRTAADGLAAALDACRRQNAVNGGMIRVLSRYAGQILDIVCGRTMGDRLYGRDGAEQPGASSRYATRV